MSNPFNNDETKDFTAPAVIPVGDEIIGDLIDGNRVTQFCSIKAEKHKDKAMLYNIMNTPDYRLADMINMEIAITDLFVEVVDIRNEKTGEVNSCPRIVLIDKDKKSYVAVSIGIFNSLKKLIGAFGQPTWKEPIVIVPKQVTKGTNSILVLTVKA